MESKNKAQTELQRNDFQQLEYEKSDIFKINQLDGIFVLGGGIVGKTIKKGNGDELRVYKPTSFYDSADRNSLAWGKERLIASAELAARFPTAIIMPLSKGIEDPFWTSEGKVTSEELIGGMKVKNPVEPHLKSMDTFTELLDALRLSIERGWSNIAIVTTYFQKPRVEAMLHSLLNIDDISEQQRIEQMLFFDKKRFQARAEDMQYFEETYKFLRNNADTIRALVIKIISSEALLLLRDDHYIPVIASALTNPIYSNEQTIERDAALKWKHGEYGKNS